MPDNFKDDAIKEALRISNIARNSGIKASDNTFEQFSDKVFQATSTEYAIAYLKLAYLTMKKVEEKNNQPSEEDIGAFVNYVYSFYGKGGIYSEFFPPRGVTKAQIRDATKEYLESGGTWGGGDSVDREFVRDIMLNKFNKGYYAEGGRVGKGARFRLNFTNTKGASGYDILKVVDTDYLSNKYNGSAHTVRVEVVDSSEPERIGTFDEYGKGSINKLVKSGLIQKLEDGGVIGEGDNIYRAYYKGKQIDLKANSSYGAQKKAAAHFKAKKSWDVSVVLLETKDGEVSHSTSEFAKGGDLSETSVYKVDVIGAELEKDGGGKHNFEYFILASSNADALHEAEKAFNEEFKYSDLSFYSASIDDEEDSNSKFAKGGGVDKKYPTLWYAIKARDGKDWDGREQHKLENLTWNQAVKKAKEIAAEHKSEVRLSKTEGYGNQGHYFHYQNFGNGGNVGENKYKIGDEGMYEGGEAIVVNYNNGYYCVAYTDNPSKNFFVSKKMFEETFAYFSPDKKSSGRKRKQGNVGSEDSFEVGTPVIVYGKKYNGEPVEQSGEIVIRDGKKGVSLYSDANYSGSSERFIIPEWGNVKQFAEGGDVEENMSIQFIDYKDHMIIYEPIDKQWFANDIEFDSLEAAKYYIDKGSKPTAKQVEAYRRGVMAKGGSLSKKHANIKDAFFLLRYNNIVYKDGVWDNSGHYNGAVNNSANQYWAQSDVNNLVKALNKDSVTPDMIFDYIKTINDPVTAEHWVRKISENQIMAKGGRLKRKSTFSDKVEAIADKFERKKVPVEYQDEYGKRYSRSEAEEAGRRIAGAQLRDYKELVKRKKRK